MDVVDCSLRSDCYRNASDDNRNEVEKSFLANPLTISAKQEITPPTPYGQQETELKCHTKLYIHTLPTQYSTPQHPKPQIPEKHHAQKRTATFTISEQNQKKEGHEFPIKGAKTPV